MWALSTAQGVKGRADVVPTPGKDYTCLLYTADRIVKNAMAEAAKGCTCPPNFPVCGCGNKPKIEILTKKPIIATREEVEENPRARSAKLRVAEKC